MSYTPGMTEAPAKDDETHIAADGTQEAMLSKARPLLTRLIADAREKGLMTALTVRGQRKIVLVTPEWYDAAREAMSERTT